LGLGEMLKPGFENDIEKILFRLLSSSWGKSVTLRTIKVSSVELVLLGVDIVFKKDLFIFASIFSHSKQQIMATTPKLSEASVVTLNFELANLAFSL
jgi:hypothetical protein